MDILILVISMSIFISIGISLMFWALNVMIMKLYIVEIPFFVLAFYRVLFSFLFVCLYLMKKKCKILKNEILINALIGFMMYYFNILLTLYGQRYLNGTSVAILNSLSSIFIIISSFVFLNKKININHIIYISLILFAFLMCINFNMGVMNKGVLFLILGLIVYNVGYLLMVKYNIKRDISSLFVQLLFALICYIIHSYFLDYSLTLHLSISDLCLFLFISGFGFVYIQNTYIKSMNSLGNIKTSAYFSLVPIFIYIVSIVFLNEKILINELISMITLVLAFFLL